MKFHGTVLYVDDLSISVRPVEPADGDVWVRMRQALWPGHSAEGHAADVDRFFRGVSSNPLAVVVAEDSSRGLVGFAEVSIRTYAEDCTTDRVGFLQGWFVDPAARRRGVGRLLVAAAEDWARRQGCTEFASDARGRQRTEPVMPLETTFWAARFGMVVDQFGVPWMINCEREQATA